jgi:retron-type reverse transcriptase
VLRLPRWRRGPGLPYQVDADDTETLIGALGGLRRFLGGQKATLVWDGLPAHRSLAIDHDVLLAQVARRVSDRRVLRLLRAWLRAGVLEDGVTTEAGSGTPQGSPISPLLANIALHVLDAEWARTGSSLGVLVRFADDCAPRTLREVAM